MGGEIIFLFPAALGYAALVTLGGTLICCIVLMAMGRWRPPSLQPGSTKLLVAATVLVLFAISFAVSFFILLLQPVPQPASAKWVAAFEVPLTTAGDRSDFLTIFEAEAAAGGLGVKVETAQEMQNWANMSPDLRRSLYAIAYRAGDFGQTEATISDQSHIGYAWIVFAQGQNPKLARRFRDRLMPRIRERWPNTLSIPLTGTGGLPHRNDLVRGNAGYEIAPDRSAGYYCGTAPGNAPPSTCD